MADEWRTPSFRQTVISKIDEAIRQSGGQITKTATEMEAHFFQRANTKDDYLHYLAKLLLHIREMNKRAVPAGNQPGGPQQGAPQGQMMNQMNVRPMMQGDQQQQQQVQQQGQQPQQQMMNPMGMQQQPQQQMMNQFAVNQQNMNMGNPLMQQLGNAQGPGPAGPNSVLVNQLSQPGMPGMGQNMPQQQQQPQQQGQQPNMSLLAAQRQRFAAVAAAKMAAQQQQQQQQQQQPTPQQSAQQQQQLMNQQLLMQQQQQQQQQRKQMEGLQAQGPSTPQQFAPSPAPMSMPSMVASSVQSQISAPSPAFVPSPGNPQIASSPASAAGRTPVPPQQQQRGMMGNLLPPPSPSMTNVATPGGGGMLHTPQGAGMGGMQPQGGVGGPMGPMGPNQQVMNEDQLYLEKVRQLSRFIEPLTRLIARYGDEDSEKQSKMKIMLDILSNPSRRMPMDTLLKCEAVLEKMDFKRSETGSLAPPSVSSVPSLGVAVPGSSSKDPPPPTAQLHPLLETIANQAKSPFINHTLRRTFSAAVETLVGCDISPPPSVCDSEDEMTEYDEMMDTLEREIANLDPRFRVSLNPHQLSGVSSLQLVCELNDKFLPKVPALQVIVPHDYPKSAPICPHEQKLFEASVFLRDVIEGLRCRISYLPARYSLGQVLHCWEMALRNACKPQSSDNLISQTSVLWGF